MKDLIVGTAGHIDHGKSALVKALTGTDPDRLEEERRRGITIDLGFAHFDLGDGVRVGFVDVPGHERFVKNMLAGVGGIDLVLLVVAADESIKPQTLEHFEICKLLSTPKGLIVITKADLVDPEILGLVKLEIQEMVKDSFLAGAPILTASAKTGEGLDAVKSELLRAAEATVPKPAGLPFRLPIDRAFVMKGFGTVVTGTLMAGSIEKDTEAEIFPGGHRVRVRGIQVHNSPASRAVAGQRTALNLAGIEAKEITRGMVLAAAGLFRATSRLDCSVSLLPSARPLKNRAKAHFHCGTAEMVVEVALLDSKELAPGKRGYAQFRLAEPGLFLPGDRFILRQFSPVVTIGGGVVLDNAPAKHRLSDPVVPAFLGILERGSEEQRMEILVGELREAPVSALTARMGRSEKDLDRIARLLEAQGRLVIPGTPPSVLVHAARFRDVANRTMAQLEDFHARNPLMAGIVKEDLRGRVLERVRRLPSPAVFDAVIQSLAGEGKIEVQGEMVRRAGRKITLNAEEEAAQEQIARAFEAAGLAVPAVGEVLARVKVDRKRSEKLLQKLLKEKVLVKIAADLVFHQSALDRLRRLLAGQKAKGPRINVAIFKDLTGLSRKYAIPLLEYLDRERVTRREGDERVIL